MKKKYVKPNICYNDLGSGIDQLAPLAGAAALVGGYVAGRVAKKAMEERVEKRQIKLERVIM